MDRLSSLVDGLREQTRAASQRESSEEDVNDTLARLFPSTRRNSSACRLAATTTSTTNNGVPQFSQWSEEAKPKRRSRRRQPRPKATKGNQNSAIKDIILLPNPNISSVPRGRKREELYVRKLVATAFEIFGDMSSSEIYNSFKTEFSNQLNGNDFEIVRAVGNKIISPNVAGGIDGRVLKHLCAQGPVYLRCKIPLETDYSWVSDDEKDESSESDNDFLPRRKRAYSRSGTFKQSLNASDDDDPPPMSKHGSARLSSDTNKQSLTVSEDDDLPPMIDWSPTPRSARLSSSTSTISGSVATDNQYSSGSRTCTASSLPTLYPTCPTCNMQFPLSEIEVHADTCCENIRNPETCLYESIMIDPQDAGEWNSKPVDTSSPSEINEEVSVKDLLEKCSALLKKPPALLFIRRKFIWDDYMEAREKPWIKPENGVRIQFVGEAAIDDGGPTREFYSG